MASEGDVSANCRPDVAPRKDPLPMFPPEIGRPEKPRPPAGAYPSQILGIIALGPPFPKFFRESFSPEFWVSWTPAGVERAIIPSMRGEGRGPFFRFFGFPLGTLPIFFGLPRCAPRGKPCLLRRRPQPPICSRTSRGRGVPPISPGTSLTRKLKLFCR